MSGVRPLQNFVHITDPRVPVGDGFPKAPVQNKLTRNPILEGLPTGNRLRKSGILYLENS